jgi:predicted Rossmann fold nucleotide-binding protein DprA/Smf involved in DNA uptake
LFSILKSPLEQPQQIEVLKTLSPLDPVDWTCLETNIFADLSYTPISIETVVQRHSVPIPLVLTILLEWEFQGRVQRHPGNMVSLLA